VQTDPPPVEELAQVIGFEWRKRPRDLSGAKTVEERSTGIRLANSVVACAVLPAVVLLAVAPLLALEALTVVVRAILGVAPVGAGRGGAQTADGEGGADAGEGEGPEDSVRHRISVPGRRGRLAGGFVKGYWQRAGSVHRRPPQKRRRAGRGKTAERGSIVWPVLPMIRR
jgi:hypothetical protein